MNLPFGIDINGLNDVDKKRIAAIGLWKWMDEICDAVKAPRSALRTSAMPRLLEAVHNTSEMGIN